MIDSRLVEGSIEQVSVDIYVQDLRILVYDNVVLLIE
jgi:hypothetical protein